METNIHFLSYLARFFFDLEMFQPKVLEKIQTHILCSITLFFFFENPVVYEKMRKNIVQPYRPQMIWRIRIACWYVRLVTHSEYVILIAFPLQQWFHERSSLLLYLHCLFCCKLCKNQTYLIPRHEAVSRWSLVVTL